MRTKEKVIMKPTAPHKPVPPKKTIQRFVSLHSDEHSRYDNFNFSVKDVPPDRDVTVCLDDYDETIHISIGYWVDEENRCYDKAMKVYEEDMKRYQENYKIYKEKLKEWNEAERMFKEKTAKQKEEEERALYEKLKVKFGNVK